jgi:hypothetical protein
MSDLNIWWHNKKINPYTNRKIKKNGKVYTNLLKECLIDRHIIDNYYNFRNVHIDPLIHMKLPIVDNKPLFEYKYCWEPLTGEVIDIDPRGSLYFDPDSLIHYFYTNRLRYLWNEGDVHFSGNYGDALGNGPEFYIPGRGYSLHYYLFRLPINDAFCDKLSNQQTTIGPNLDFNDILNIYQLSCSYGNNYKNLYGIDRPNILDIYELYHEAIKKNIIDKQLQDDLLLSREEVENNKFIYNKVAVDKLKNI